MVTLYIEEEEEAEAEVEEEGNGSPMGTEEKMEENHIR